jgi:hypothetical protein
MHFQLITVAAAFFGAVTAIPCSEIGWSSGNPNDPNTIRRGLDPWDPQGRWEVVKAKDCWARFQSVRPDETRLSTRVTKTKFEATPEQVRGTMNSYFNGGNSNIMLWLPLVSKSFQYVRTSPSLFPIS